MHNSLSDFRYRQIHLDFHTSEHIKDIGSDFDSKDFANTLKNSAVNSVTLFARCHHGWCYYPTEVGESHPHLTQPDLLGDMIAACHEVDIATPVYLTVQWDEYIARKHPEWRVMQAQNRAANYPGTEPSAMNQLTPTWHTLCLNQTGYVDYLIKLGLEIAHRYNPPALFMDIHASWQCTCGNCLDSMKVSGLNPLDASDRQTNDKQVLLNFFERYAKAVHEEFPDIRIFFNSGHIYKGERDRYKHYGHMELESLPTGGWGYDHFPASARYADTLGLPYLGMTGRFHTHWGEFGGFKRPEALIYECCQMIALGARCSIGDQLAPNGKIDKDVYKLIEPAYRRVEMLEPYAIGANYLKEVAIISVESQQTSSGAHLDSQAHPSDNAAVRMLLEMQIPFDLIDADRDLSEYRLVILPDDIRLDESLAKRISDFVDGGGAIIASYNSGLNAEGTQFLLNIGASLSDDIIDYKPSYLKTNQAIDSDLPDSSIVMYGDAKKLNLVDGDALADIRAPYFNRQWDHFCSHLHTPENPDAKSLSPAIVQNGRVGYIAYPIFKMYSAVGQPHYKYLVRGFINKYIKQGMMGTELPSSARMSLMEQKDMQRLIVHLLYAPTQTRGQGHQCNDGQERAIEIIEDAPRLNNVSVWVRTNKKPIGVHCVYTGIELPYTYYPDQERLDLNFPEFYIHGAASIDYSE